MKKSALIFYAILTAVALYSQEKVDENVQQILMSKTWHWGENTNSGLRLIFTQDSVKFYFVGMYGYDNIKGKYPYYLSNTEEHFFDKNKIGKYENGIYIVEKINPRSNKSNLMRILDISDNQIKLENINIKNEKKIITYTAVN